MNNNLSKKFTEKLEKIMLKLLKSKESECRTGGLNICGSLCGLGYNYDDHVGIIK